MLVNRYSTFKCRADYGKSSDRKMKLKLKRAIRRRDKRTWKREV